MTQLGLSFAPQTGDLVALVRNVHGAEQLITADAGNSAPDSGPRHNR